MGTVGVLSPVCSDLIHKSVRFTPIWTNPEFFPIRFKYIKLFMGIKRRQHQLHHRMENIK